MGDTQSGLLWSTNQVMNLIVDFLNRLDAGNLSLCRSSPVLVRRAHRVGKMQRCKDWRRAIPLLSLGIRNARTAEIVRMAKTAGFGLVWIDLEHSSISIDCAVQIIASAADLGLEAWVRVPEREYGAIGRLLDGGATGIIAPRVETAEEAQNVVNASRFPPRGQRSQIALLPQAKYRRMSAAELMRCADSQQQCIF